MHDRQWFAVVILWPIMRLQWNTYSIKFEVWAKTLREISCCCLHSCLMKVVYCGSIPILPAMRKYWPSGITACLNNLSSQICCSIRANDYAPQINVMFHLYKDLTQMTQTWQLSIILTETCGLWDKVVCCLKKSIWLKTQQYFRFSDWFPMTWHRNKWFP